MAPPLRQGQGQPFRLCVGSRDCPFGPFEFTIPEGAKSDLAFLKLFVSTNEVNMDSIIQPSAFSNAPDIEEELSRGGGPCKWPNVEAWESYQYTVTVT